MRLRSNLGRPIRSDAQRKRGGELTGGQQRRRRSRRGGSGVGVDGAAGVPELGEVDDGGRRDLADLLVTATRPEAG
jgi:hypothetical protein